MQYLKDERGIAEKNFTFLSFFIFRRGARSFYLESAYGYLNNPKLGLATSSFQNLLPLEYKSFSSNQHH